MKDFQQFLKTIDFQSINDSVANIPQSDNLLEYHQALNTAIMIELLRQYHEWLNQ